MSAFSEGTIPSVDRNASDLDTRILSATPNLAIEQGFDQHIVDSMPDTALRNGASKSVAEFDGFCETFTIGSRERLYLTTLRMAATSMASGMTRRKRILNDRLNSAEVEQDVFLRSFARGQRLGGFLSGALKLLLLGGFSMILVRTVFANVVPDADAVASPKMDPNHMSLATALGVTLIGAYLREFYQGWQLGRAMKRFKKAVDSANTWYQEEISKEYKLAAETANNAWLQLTGKPALMTGAFERLLLGVMQTCVQQIPPNGHARRSILRPLTSDRTASTLVTNG